MVPGSVLVWRKKQINPCAVLSVGLFDAKCHINESNQVVYFWKKLE